MSSNGPWYGSKFPYDRLDIIGPTKDLPRRMTCLYGLVDQDQGDTGPRSRVGETRVPLLERTNRVPDVTFNLPLFTKDLTVPEDFVKTIIKVSGHLIRKFSLE